MTDKIRILIDCHVFDGTFQGTTTYLRGLYQEMVNDKGKAFYFASNDSKALQQIFGTADNIHYVNYSSHNKFYRLLIDIPRLIKAHKIDYAHFQYIVPPFKYCKYINTIHDVLFLDYGQYFPLGYKIKNKLLFSWGARHSDIVLTVSEYSKTQIEKHFGIRNVTVTPNAIDAVFFETYDKEKIKAVVQSQYGVHNYWIFISRWEPRKNHHRLLKVFVENTYFKDYYLVLVGDKAIENPEFYDLYDSLDPFIKDKVKILSKINFQDLLLLLRGAELSVYPSIAEGFGIPPLEAAAASVPSVCSNTTAMADFYFLEEGLFDPLSVEDMNDKIKAVLKVKNLEPKKTAVRKIFSWSISATKLSTIIDMDSANK